MKQQKLQISCLFLAALLGTSCSSENDPITPIDPANDPDAIELGITAGVSLTKSAINSGAQSGTGSEMQSLAVYAVGNASSYASGNNYAIYTPQADGWTRNGTTDKIFLTNEVATIYAYHPAYKPKTGGVMIGTDALKINEGTPSDTATVNISVFPGNSGAADTDNKYPEDINNADKTWQTNIWSNNTTTDASKIISAPGEIDYMYAVKTGGNGTEAATASNGKTAGSSTVDAHKVSLDMKHALSMVSFRIYNDGTYTNTGKLTKIKLSNVSSGTALSTGTTPKMKISDGTIVENAAVAATYTRFIENGYTIIRIGTPASASVATSENDAKEGSKKFSILVLPHTGAKDQIQVTFTIDDADYAIPLASNSTSVGWEAGNNYLYTAKLSGKELSISSVTVSEWTAATGGNLEVN